MIILLETLTYRAELSTRTPNNISLVVATQKKNLRN